MSAKILDIGAVVTGQGADVVAEQRADKAQARIKELEVQLEETSTKLARLECLNMAVVGLMDMDEVEKRLLALMADRESMTMLAAGLRDALTRGLDKLPALRAVGEPEGNIQVAFTTAAEGARKVVALLEKELPGTVYYATHGKDDFESRAKFLEDLQAKVAERFPNGIDKPAGA